jgi:very-short-patch-repair endonuclease
MPKSIEYRAQAFFKTANKKFKNKFDYSNVEYNNNCSKVTINCPDHGDFLQTPASHIQSKFGCPKCGQDETVKYLKSNTSKFIESAKILHGDKYDYSNVNYYTRQDKIEIICPIHGSFFQKPKKHLSGQGCKRCVKVLSTEQFLGKVNYVHGNTYDYSLVNYRRSLDKIEIICPIHGSFFQTANNHISKGCGCPKCSSTESKYEEFLKTKLKGIIFRERIRDVIPPLELDFYLLDYKIAIEVNGIYWHSELRGKDKNYHLNKTNLCKEKDIQLFHINQNEIDNTPRIVESKLKSILNISKRKIHGRKCEVREIDTKLKSKFLNKYHLQGNDKSSVKLGLFYNDHLVSVMTFCKRRIAMGKKTSEEGEYELSRYCGNFNFYVIGGASKLLKYFERNYNPKKIVTYADKRWSKGDLYFKLGFTHTHDSKPNYWYFNDSNNSKLYHRFNFRKSELSKKLPKFDSNKTEWENMVENGWNRIWDCGNMVFEKIY